MIQFARVYCRGNFLSCNEVLAQSFIEGLIFVFDDCGERGLEAVGVGNVV